MANGQPKPAFYVAVLVAILALVGLALYRYGGIGNSSQPGQISSDELKQMQKGAEAPDASRPQPRPSPSRPSPTRLRKTSSSCRRPSTESTR